MSLVVFALTLCSPLKGEEVGTGDGDLLKTAGFEPLLVLVRVNLVSLFLLETGGVLAGEVEGGEREGEEAVPGGEEEEDGKRRLGLLEPSPSSVSLVFFLVDFCLEEPPDFVLFPFRLVFFFDCICDNSINITSESNRERRETSVLTKE